MAPTRNAEVSSAKCKVFSGRRVSASLTVWVEMKFSLSRAERVRSWLRGTKGLCSFLRDHRFTRLQWERNCFAKHKLAQLLEEFPAVGYRRDEKLRDAFVSDTKEKFLARLINAFSLVSLNAK